MMENPIIIFGDDDASKIVAMWLKVDEDYVNTYLGTIFSQLGFRSDDLIDIYGYTKTGYLLFRVNDNEDCRIRMASNKNNPEVYFCKEDSEIGYECLFDKYRKFDLRLKVISGLEEDVVVEKDEVNYSDEKINDNGVVIDSLSVEKDYIDYRVDTGEFVIELRVSKNHYYDRLKNKDMLFEYLSKLVYPVSIFDVYKCIAEISLDKDICKYELIDLRILKWDIEMEDYKITDLITISEGKLTFVFVTRNGKEISSYNGDIWMSDTDKVGIEFITVRTDSLISFNTRVRLKDNVERYNEEMIDEDVMDAKVEVTKVKKLVKDTFFRR